jgi:DNA-binding beta-propeller fold protein YncE
MTVNDLFAPEADQAPPTPEPRRSHRRRLIVVLAVVSALLVILTAVAGWYLRTGKPLSQLPGIAQDTKPHYAFSIYGVTQPLGVAVSRNGDRIYVTESGGQRLVRIFGRDGKQVGTLTPPAAPSGGHIPVYIAVNPVTDEVYVSDRMSAAILVYGKDGAYRRTFAPKGDLGKAWSPLGLAFDRQGRLVVTDVRSSGGHRVLVFSPDGTLQRSLGEGLGLSYPNGVVVDDRGVVVVCDSNNARVLLFAPDGAPVGRIVSGAADNLLGLPRGIATDDGKRLYVVDAADHTVQIYRIPDAVTGVPSFVGSFGAEGTGDGTFEYPNGVATDSHARLYITDRENNRVQVWSY